jgi:glycosyltransferase involved in cell wall biosynthesis
MPHELDISVVTPVYGCRTCLFQLYARLRQALEHISENFEIIMVNDGSPDGAWTTIMELCGQDPRVKGLDLSRNFGQHNAITAGLDYAAGQWIVVMDCDLQDQPEEILKLYEATKGGYDVVFGRRINRRDVFLKRLSSRIFNALMGVLMDQKLDPTTANFGIYNRSVIQAFRRIRDVNRSFPVFVRWLGFRQTSVDIEHAERPEGESSYTLTKLISFAVSNITAYSNKPLILSIYFGLIVSGCSFLTGAYFIFRYLQRGIGVEGWTSLMVSLYFIAGLLFANLGILGLYVGKVLDQSKGRPLYVIREVLNVDEFRQREAADSWQRLGVTK